MISSTLFEKNSFKSEIIYDLIQYGSDKSQISLLVSRSRVKLGSNLDENELIVELHAHKQFQAMFSTMMFLLVQSFKKKFSNKQSNFFLGALYSYVLIQSFFEKPPKNKESCFLFSVETKLYFIENCICRKTHRNDNSNDVSVAIPETEQHSSLRIRQ